MQWLAIGGAPSRCISQDVAQRRCTVLATPTEGWRGAWRGMAWASACFLVAAASTRPALSCTMTESFTEEGALEHFPPQVSAEDALHSAKRQAPLGTLGGAWLSRIGSLGLSGHSIRCVQPPVRIDNCVPRHTPSCTKTQHSSISWADH